METVVQIAGMGWCALCLGCIVWTFGQYIIGSIDRPGKRNKKLTDNMNKLGKS
jgi:hypothetical protein